MIGADNMIEQNLRALCLAHAPSGYEKEVAYLLRDMLMPFCDEVSFDKQGNVIGKMAGTDPDSPRVMTYAHMDSVGFIVRKIEPNGFIQIDRLGGIPEKVLPALKIAVRTMDGKYVTGVFGNKSHHAASAEEKYKVEQVTSMFIDIGACSAAEVHALGIEIGCPAIYEPQFEMLENNIACATSLDNRGGCAALVEIARHLSLRRPKSDTFIVGTVWEEFNLRGAIVAARRIKPDISFCLDVNLAGDTKDLAGRFDSKLGGGVYINMYSFHGRGTLNGTLPHPNLVSLADKTARECGIPYGYFASLGIITDSAYVQFEGDSVACLDFSFAARYTHTPTELCSLDDLDTMARLVSEITVRINNSFDLYRW